MNIGFLFDLSLLLGLIIGSVHRQIWSRIFQVYGDKDFKPVIIYVPEPIRGNNKSSTETNDDEVITIIQRYDVQPEELSHFHNIEFKNTILNYDSEARSVITNPSIADNLIIGVLV